MSKRKTQRARKSRKRSLDSGLWLKVAEGTFFEVKSNKISSAKIVSDMPLRYGIRVGNQTKLLEKKSYPVLRADAGTIVKKKFAEMDFTAENLFGKDDEGADGKFSNLINAVCKTVMTIPAKYRWSYADHKLVEYPDPEYFRVTGFNEATGREILKEADYLEQTHQIHELVEDEQGNMIPQVMPRDLWDLWLTDHQYELKPYDDASRFGLYKFAQKLDNYPMPNPDGEGTINQKVMLYMQGYISKTGYSAKAYYALIRPVWLKGEDGEDKFIFEMKLSRTVTKYQKAVPVPKPGEVPTVLTAPQKSLDMMGVADMLAQVTVKSSA
jgi:hypothetical protein